jgi:hypothetical protein
MFCRPRGPGPEVTARVSRPGHGRGRRRPGGNRANVTVSGRNRDSVTDRTRTCRASARQATGKLNLKLGSDNSDDSATLMSRVRYLPQSGRSRSTIPDVSRRSPMLNLPSSLPRARPMRNMDKLERLAAPTLPVLCIRAFCRTVMGQGKYDLRSSDNSDAHVPGSIPASVRQVPVDNSSSRRFPTLPNAKPSLPRARPMRNMDKRQHRHCFLSAHFAELSWPDIHGTVTAQVTARRSPAQPQAHRRHPTRSHRPRPACPGPAATLAHRHGDMTRRPRSDPQKHNLLQVKMLLKLN